MKNELILELVSSPIVAVIVAILATAYYLITHWQNGWKERVVRTAKCLSVALITYSISLLLIGKLFNNIIIGGMLASGIMGVTVSYSEAFFDKIKSLLFALINKEINKNKGK